MYIYIYVHVLHASFHWHRDSPPRSAWTGLKRGPTHDSCVQATKETRGRRTEDEEEWTWLDRAREKQLPRTPTPSASLIFHILPPHRRPIFKPMPPPPLPPPSLSSAGEKNPWENGPDGEHLNLPPQPYRIFRTRIGFFSAISSLPSPPQLAPRSLS